MDAQGTPIKTVRVDQAGENGKALTKLCNKKEINLKLTPPGTPQMNGKVKRRQAVLIYISLADMHATNLKESTRRMLWNKAVNYSNNAVAIAYNRTLGGYPYKLFNNKASKMVKHLQLFGRIGEVAYIGRKDSRKMDREKYSNDNSRVCKEFNSRYLPDVQPKD